VAVTIAKISGLAAACLVLAACSMSSKPGTKTKEFFSVKQFGAASPQVVDAGQPVPKGGGRHQIGKSYRVAGMTYVPEDNPSYSAIGYASWYGDAFHGRQTANGEIYDMHDLTAAHPTLPLPSYVRVTNLANGRSVVVRVNDRGPFARNRIIDVSKTVAAMLDFEKRGVAKVKVDYVGRADLDGRDRNMLLASYVDPSRPAAASAFPANGNVQLVQPPSPRLKTAYTSDVTLRQDNAGGTFEVNPTSTLRPANDLLAPLILNSGGASSFAPTNAPGRAHAAAAALASGGDPVIVQLGTFANRSNATRVADEFSRFGGVETLGLERPGKVPMSVIRVAVHAGTSASTVITAADNIGLGGAFIVSQ
jgi:rare lipoprotein A (peptidoglycan hydrolase)